MELDLLAAAETESDSESNHSNQDNASGRRSVVTAATAGSEAGNVLFIHLHFDATELQCVKKKSKYRPLCFLRDLYIDFDSLCHPFSVGARWPPWGALAHLKEATA